MEVNVTKAKLNLSAVEQVAVRDWGDLADDQLVTIKTACAIAQVSVPTGWRYIKNGIWPKTVKLTPGATRLRVGDLRQVLAKQA